MCHTFIYTEEDSEDKTRKCSVCQLEEIWDDDIGWIWNSTEEFMDSAACCHEREQKKEK